MNKFKIGIAIVVILVVVGIVIVVSSSPKVTLNVDDPQTIHVGDEFLLNATVYNAGIIPLEFYNFDFSNDFDKNAFLLHYQGCSSVGENFEVQPFHSMEIAIPNGGSCQVDIANSTGMVNSIVTLNYTVFGKAKSIHTSKSFMIYPNDTKVTNRLFPVIIEDVYKQVHLNFKDCYKWGCFPKSQLLITKLGL